MSQQHSGNSQPAMDREEHYTISNLNGKGVFVFDASGNQITSFGSIASGTGTSSSVNDSASNATLLAANASRKGAAIFNESSVILYLKCGATASATSYTVQIAANSYYEVPFGYTGRIDGIWASDGSGAARITEFT